MRRVAPSEILVRDSWSNLRVDQSALMGRAGFEPAISSCKLGALTGLSYPSVDDVVPKKLSCFPSVLFEWCKTTGLLYSTFHGRGETASWVRTVDLVTCAKVFRFSTNMPCRSFQMVVMYRLVDGQDAEATRDEDWAEKSDAD